MYLCTYVKETIYEHTYVCVYIILNSKLFKFTSLVKFSKFHKSSINTIEELPALQWRVHSVPLSCDCVGGLRNYGPLPHFLQMYIHTYTYSPASLYIHMYVCACIYACIYAYK